MHACSCWSKTWRSHFGILIENLSDTQHTNFWAAHKPHNPQHRMNLSAEDNNKRDEHYKVVFLKFQKSVLGKFKTSSLKNF